MSPNPYQSETLGYVLRREKVGNFILSDKE